MTALLLTILLGSSTPIPSSNVLGMPASTGLIDMEAAGKASNQLALNLHVTPGDSTRVRLQCTESNNGSEWSLISICETFPDEAFSSCKPDVRQFTLSDYPTVGGIKRIVARWSVRQRYVRCETTDPDAGTGTIRYTGSRSWQ